MILFLDTETTGFPSKRKDADDPTQPYMVELAMLVCEDDGTVVSDYSSLVLPLPDQPEISEDLIAIHGITTERTKNEGKLLSTVLGSLKLFADDVDLLAGFNVELDIGILRIACKRAKMTGLFAHLSTMSSICLMEQSRPWCRLPYAGGKRPGQYKNPKLTQAHQILCGEPYEGAHTATADTEACRRLYLAIKAREYASAQEFAADEGLPRGEEEIPF